MKPPSPIAVAASLLLVAGCGTTRAGVDVTTEPTANDGATTDGNTMLTVEVRTFPGKRTYTLLCNPPGGNHPDPEAACRALMRSNDPFAPVPPDAMCTEIYGGPQTATVTGRLKGKPVDARFSRIDGCEIERWDNHAALLVERGGVGGS